MNNQISFSTQPIFSSNILPLTIMSLEDLVLIMVSGNDVKTYLQSQLTCDLNLLNKKNFVFSAHCDLRGKVISCLYVFYFLNGIACILRKSLLNEQIRVLKKYSIFSKVNISIYDNKFILIGIAGLHAKKFLKKIFSYIPDKKKSLVQDKETTLLYFDFPSSRYLLITTHEIYNFLKKHCRENVLFKDSKQWLLLDIESNYPIIDFPNNNKFFPQSINIKKFNGISFNKGCYLGQESISRHEYLGKDKLMLHLLKGKSKFLPKIGEKVKIKISGEWIQTGTILSALELYNNEVWLQVILKNIDYSNTIFCTCKDETSKFLLN